jgi:hypothetical protein
VKIIPVPADHGVSVGDIYQAGLIEKESKPFRMENIEVKRSEVTISAIEYVDSIYDEWTQDVQILNYSGFGNRPLSANYVPNVTGITLKEKTVITGTATTSHIVVSFNKVTIFNKTSENVRDYEIYYKLATAPTWTKAGSTNRTSFQIPNVVRGKKSSDQSVTSNADAVIAFNDDYDSNNWWNASTYQFQPTIAGYYLIHLNVWWDAGAVTNNQSNIQIFNFFLINHFTLTTSISKTSIEWGGISSKSRSP